MSATAHDVAAYILQQRGEMSTMKLQKLVYYSQAWSLAWDERPIFAEEIQAWANGPVVRALYGKHRGLYSVGEWPHGNPSNLSKDERETVDAVLGSYGGLSGRQLSHLTHSEAPWQVAREGLSPTDRSERSISTGVMQSFYSALDADRAATFVADIAWE